MSYVTEDQEIKNENKVGVVKKGDSMDMFCHLHCSQHSWASLSISVTLATSPHERSLERFQGHHGMTWHAHLWLTRVPDRGLKHQDGVVAEEVGDDEASVLVDGLLRVHACQEPQHVAVQATAVTLHELDEVPLGRFGQEAHAGA